MQRGTTNLFRYTSVKYDLEGKGNDDLDSIYTVRIKLFLLYAIYVTIVLVVLHGISFAAIFSIESEDADRFIRESNLSIIQRYVENNIDDPDEKVRDVVLDENNSSLITGLGKHMCLCKKLYYLIFYCQDIYNFFFNASYTGPDIASMMSANDHSNELKGKDSNFESVRIVSFILVELNYESRFYYYRLLFITYKEIHECSTSIRCVMYR